MHNLKHLQIKKLIKELDYIESDFEYKSEVINEIDNDFINNINTILDLHTDLKEIYEENKSKKIVKLDNLELNSNNLVKDVKLIYDISPRIKKIYRDIVKLTHPDKTSSLVLKELYIKSTLCYEINDKIGLYKICEYLNINYDIDEEDEQIIQDKITIVKNKLSFIEQNMTWKWFKSSDENEKNRILVDYIRQNIL